MPETNIKLKTGREISICYYYDDYKYFEAYPANSDINADEIDDLTCAENDEIFQFIRESFSDFWQYQKDCNED